MTEVEAAAANPNDEEDKDEGDEIYSDPNGELSKKRKTAIFNNFCCFSRRHCLVSRSIWNKRLQR